MIKETHLDAKSFLKFMKSSNSVSHILHEFAQMTKDLETNQDLETMMTEENASKVFIQPLNGLKCIKTAFTREMAIAAKSTSSYDVNKFLCMKDPTKDNLNQFWSLVLNKNSNFIVMLSVKGKINHQYWNPEEGSEVECNELKIRTIKVREMDSYTTTWLQLKPKNEVSSEIVHFHYTAWPADNMTHSPIQLASFISIVSDMTAWESKQRNQDAPASGPIVVHCSDGINKSGVFCLLDMCITKVKKGESVSVPKALRMIRRVNGNYIIQPENYVFCYNELYHFIIKGMMKFNWQPTI
uniref:Protein tyrosine phosphatase n=1 Tax=Glyptapanteles indiensis TaxID=92994 RepID=B7S8Z0_GLYIN|nr:protein tyrosine phosphatase [Glyptapanteles indiensis]